MTEQIVEAGRILGIPVMDHVIIGDACYVSFVESGLLVRD
jgi:DNA repair protein RadC